VVVYTGPLERAEQLTDELAKLGPSIVRAVAPVPWSAANRMLDAIAPYGRRCFSRGGYVPELSDAVIDVAIRHTAAAPSPATAALPSTVQNFWAMGGAISEDFDEKSTAFSREGANWFWEVVTQCDRPSDDDTFYGWVEALRAEIKPHLRNNGYVNLSVDQGPEWRRSLWGSPDKYARLVRAKTTWDPHNLLRFNKNIEPATPA
jgi:hypothetical protein